MIPRECKRLAEVDFPIAEVSKHSAREKSIRHGHPSTMHLWWARRPLSACRAMLLALLLPDPCDAACPEEFKTAAVAALAKTWKTPKSDTELRSAMLQFIADFANWERASDQVYLETARDLVKIAYPQDRPSVVDTFAGGGSIPLEALRLGGDVYASDLNPVACLVLKVMLEHIPRQGGKLAEELRSAGAKVKSAAEKELSSFYPTVDGGGSPIAYLWARTVRCETPNCGAEIPLARSFWLAKKENRKRALQYRVVRPHGKTPKLEFEVFEPKAEAEVQGGTVSRAKATCPCCNVTLPAERVRAQLTMQKGGADVRFDEDGRRVGGALLLAVVTVSDDSTGRKYRLPCDSDYKAVWHAHQRLAKLRTAPLSNGLDPVPGECIPSTELRRISLPIYGCTDWGSAFMSRQKLALLTLSRCVEQIGSATCRELLAFGISKQADFNSSIARWANHMEKSVATFGRQALPMLWDWAEVVPFSNATGAYDVAIEWIARSVETIAQITAHPGQVEIADAAKPPLPRETSDIWFTDPPYYDAVPYSHLADYFYVWLRRINGLGRPGWFGGDLCPKDQECVVDRPHRLSNSTKTPTYFHEKMAAAMAAGRTLAKDDGLGCIVFAHKTTEGWEALLSGIIRGGWTITASWPVATEKADRLNAQDNASLATSIHLVCRPRVDDLTGDWGAVLRELPKRVGDWMARLEKEGVRGADLVFACIGPALEIFSR